MPWVNRVDGLVRGFAAMPTSKFTEWLEDGNPDVEEYQAYLEDQVNPTPGRRADRILTGQKERVLFKALFKLENRVRTLEGQPILTEADYVEIAKASYFEEIS